MRTLLTTSPEEAAAIIRLGGLVAFPTETVYGLGADVFNEKAVRRIFEAKQRPGDNPLIAHVSDAAEISSLASVIPDSASRLISRFFPGPLTVVIPKSPFVPVVATAGLESIGVRMPSHELAGEFLRNCGTPVVAPSANLSGRPSPTSWRAVLEDLEGSIECILQGEDTEIGLESTVVDCTAQCPTVLRLGAVSLEELREVIPAIVVAGDGHGPPRSPGMRHKHYSPRANVILVDAEIRPTDNASRSFIGINEPVADYEMVKVCDSLEEYGRSLFEFLRESDRRKISSIYCETVSDEGIGAAIMDRLRRAAER